jgi:hypothetical protein
MKIYIANVSLSNINNNLKNLNNYIVNKNGKIIYELCTKNSGIYLIENSKLYKLVENTEENYELIKNYRNYDLLIDYTEYIKKEIKSQVPLNYILTKKINYEYKIHKSSNLSLIVEYEYNNNENERKVIDFYLIYDEINLDMKNMFFQEELNMFLFYLN